MLYETWLQVCEEFADLPALHDYGQGKKFTFRELREAAEALEGPASPIVFPQGNQFSSILEILRAWKEGSVVCPLEVGEKTPEISVIPHHCCHIKITSASSGSPKFIAFTASQLKADCDNIISTMGLRREWPQVGLISISHSYGFSSLVTPLLLRGIPLILAPSPFPDTLRSILGEYSSVVLPGVPALWKAWADAGALNDHIKLAISAGSPLSLALETACYQTCKLKIHNFYGSSECGGIAYDASPEPRKDAGNLGPPLDNVMIAVGGDGCLEVRSGAVGEGYLGKTSPRLGNGLFWTQDIGEVVDGEVLLRGRMADVINIAGRKLSPETVENAISSTGLAKNVLVFGVPSKDVERSDEIVALVEMQPGKEVEEIRPRLLQLLPAWQIPRVFKQIDELQMNQRGKISRAEWRRRFLSGKE